MATIGDIIEANAPDRAARQARKREKKAKAPAARVRAFNLVAKAESDRAHIRPNITEAQWRDPEDALAMERDADGRRHQRTIKGFRAIDPLDRLPCESNHRKAVARLRSDWERGSGARSGGSDAGRVDGGSRDHDSIAAGMEARRCYQDAVQALGMRASAYVLPVALSGWTVADLVGKHGGNAMATQGRVMAGLDRLAEHYFGDGDVVPFVVPLSPILVDPSVTHLEQERLGRWRK